MLSRQARRTHEAAFFASVSEHAIRVHLCLLDLFPPISKPKPLLAKFCCSSDISLPHIHDKTTADKNKLKDMACKGKGIFTTVSDQSGTSYEDRELAEYNLLQV